ncbi:MAG: GAF domain-containing protein [Elusimicrobiota bacterium]
MAKEITIIGTTKKEKYENLISQIKHLLSDETDMISGLSNFLSAIHFTFNFLWTGIYFVKGDFLVLGPFQGPVACSRIPYGKGVCGTSWKRKKAIIVKDVNKFPGHIACSSKSRSEIVIPILNSKKSVTAVLDIDSEKLSNFDRIDLHYLKKALKSVLKFFE